MLQVCISSSFCTLSLFVYINMMRKKKIYSSIYIHTAIEWIELSKYRYSGFESTDHAIVIDLNNECVFTLFHRYKSIHIDVVSFFFIVLINSLGIVVCVRMRFHLKSLSRFIHSHSQSATLNDGPTKLSTKPVKKKQQQKQQRKKEKPITNSEWRSYGCCSDTIRVRYNVFVFFFFFFSSFVCAILRMNKHDTRSFNARTSRA